MKYIGLRRIGARCKSKTGRHNQEIGDQSCRATASSHENCRRRWDRLLRSVVGDLDRSSGNREYVLTRTVLDLQLAPSVLVSVNRYVNVLLQWKSGTAKRLQNYY